MKFAILSKHLIKKNSKIKNFAKKKKKKEM
jgi:hypothetical protein